jgi:BTB/POZ domain
MSAKRKRSEISTEAERLPIKCRSDSIWFTDGNIILEAEGQQFRVHRGVLAKHSAFFKDMFEMPQPPDESTVEDCPVVDLTDSAQDVDHLLNALYDR